MTLFSEREYFRQYAAPAPAAAAAPTATSYTEPASSPSTSSTTVTAPGVDEKRRGMLSGSTASPSMFEPGQNPFALGYVDYNSIPEWMRVGPDGNPSPFTKVWGQQLGLDNNYNYGIMPDGSVQQLYWGGDPTFDPNTQGEISPFIARNAGLTAGPNPDHSRAMTSQQLADEFGWDYGAAPRDAHGYAKPGMLGGLDFEPYNNPGIHHQTGLDMILGDILPAVALAVGVNAVAGPYASGAMMGGIAADNAGKNPFAGAAAGALTAGVGSWLNPTMTQMGVPSYVTPAITQAGVGMLNGQAPADALKGGAISAGIGAGAEAGAPYFADAPMPPTLVAGGDPNLGTMFDAGVLDQSLIGPKAGAAPGSGSMFAPDASMFGSANADTLDRSLIGPDAGAAPGSGSAFAPDAARQAQLEKAKSALEKVGKLGAALLQADGGHSTPKDAPKREQGQSDAEYSQQLVQYANLDAKALADQGLTPGTPQYYEYVMSQLDSIVNQLTSGLDPNADLAGQLRTKTREELDQLERILYVRGMMQTLMGSGSYRDPFTGIAEDVIAPEGKQVNPALGAYTRGLARSADELAQLAPGDARNYVGSMLKRSPDLYGMQASADEQAKAEAFAAQGIDYEDWKRRRGGMLSVG